MFIIFALSKIMYIIVYYGVYNKCRNKIYNNKNKIQS